MKFFVGLVAFWGMIFGLGGGCLAAPVVATHYFYWYDNNVQLGHVWDDAAQTDDALQDHPINLKLDPLNAQDPDWPQFSTFNTAWHEQQLRDIMDAGIEIILPIYWGDAGNAAGWAKSSLPNLVEAVRNIQDAGDTPPAIGLFYDTTSIPIEIDGDPFAATDITTEAGKAVVYRLVKAYWEQIPTDLWARYDGKPIIVTYGRFNMVYDQSTWDYLYTHFEADFGVRPYVVVDDAWASAATDARVRWAAAPFGVNHYSDLNWASVGPGFNNSAVPGGNLIKDREDGVYYQDGWLTVINQTPAGKPGVIVETWNELHEGSDIAHTHEYGRRYINMTRLFTDLLATSGSGGQSLTVDEVDYVYFLNWSVLRRAPSSQGILDGVAAVRAASGDRSGLALAYIDSAEYQGKFIAKNYAMFLDAQPGSGEAQTLQAVFDGGGGQLDVLAQLLASDAFYAHAGGTNQAWLNEMYQRAMGQWPSLSVASAALSALGSGTSRATIARQMLDSTQYRTAAVSKYYALFAGRAPSAGELAAGVALLAGGGRLEEAMALAITEEDFITRAKANFGHEEKMGLVEIAGTVDARWTSDPLEKARISFYDANDIYLGCAGVDAADGSYSARDVALLDTIKIRARCPGYRDQYQTVSPGEESSLTADFELWEKVDLTLAHAMQFAAESLELVSVDPDTDGEPYHGFYLNDTNGHVELAHALEIGIPHMTGRAVDALLFTEEVTGRAVDASTEAGLTRHMHESFDNVHHINDYKIDGASHIEFHNLREGMHGLAALIKYRADAQAATDAVEMLASLDSITNADGTFSGSAITAQGNTSYYHGWEGPPPGHSGRFVGALMKYYRETGSELAMTLAQKYALHCLDTAFADSGELIGSAYETGAGNHVHSITSALSSILLWTLELQKQGITSLEGSNLLSNAGWDVQTGSVTLGDEQAATFDNGATLTGWQLYCLGGTPAGSATFTSQAEASAPSAPNVLVVTKNVAPGDSAVRKDIVKSTIQPGVTYRHSMWLRDVDGDPTPVHFYTGLFDASDGFLGAYGEITATPTGEWTLFSQTFTAPANAASGSFQFRLTPATGSVQVDSASLTAMDGRNVADIVAKCKKVFDNGFDIDLSTTYGWIKEERRDGTTRGEMNQVGDMIQAALFLAQQGYPEYYEMAERYMRSSVLAVQLLGVSSLQENPAATLDYLKNIRRRAHGCFGFPMPNDRYDLAEVHAISALDVTAGTLQAMCEFAKTIYTQQGGTLTVNLLFDVDNDDVQIVSHLPGQGLVEITPATAQSVRMFLPSWVDRTAVQVLVDGATRSASVSEPFLEIGVVSAGQTAQVGFDIPVFTQSEVAAGNTYVVDWQGSQVTAVTPVGGCSPIFQASPPPTQVWGRVTDQEDGSGLAGVQVALLTGAGEALASATTDQGGNYAIDLADLPTGTYSVQATFAGSLPQLKTGIAMESGVPVTVDFGLTLGDTLSGTVSVYASDQVLAGAQVDLLKAGSLVSSALTQASGRYYFSLLLDEGYYQVRVSAGGYVQQWASVYLNSTKAAALDFILYPDATVNLIGNPGWDESTGAVTLGDGQTSSFDSGVTLPGWQAYAIGGTPAGSSTFTALATGEAHGGANVLVFSKDAACADSAVRRDSSPVSVIAGHVYKAGVALRDTDGTLNSLNVYTTMFPSVTVAGGVSLQATDQWEIVESAFVAPTGDTQASMNLRLTDTVGSFWLDSSFLNDVTAGNRLTNPGFENSPTRLLEWDTFAVSGRSVACTLSADAASGDWALRIAQTNTAGDGGCSRDGHKTPWDGESGVGYDLSLKLKDDVTLATGDYVTVRVCEFNEAGAVVVCSLDKVVPAGSGAYDTYRWTVETVDPATRWLSLSLRVSNSSGVGKAGDVLVDDVELRLTGLDFEEVKTAVHGWELY